MNINQEHFIIVLIVLIAGLFIYQGRTDLQYIISTFDGKGYFVREKNDSLDAANLLAQVSQNLSQLCNSLKKKYPTNEGVDRLIKKFDPTTILETEKGSKHTSYSVNKGEKIVLCLRSRDDTEKLADLNTLMFVALHELSHIMTISVGHQEEFWKNFKFLLKEAIGIRIYKYVDYNNKPQKYCGIDITDTPLNNKSL